MADGPDTELAAMRICIAALAPIERKAQIRVLEWLEARLNADAILAERPRSEPGAEPRTASKA